MKIGYYGKFGEYNTERYIAEALRESGVEVTENQQDGCDWVMWGKQPVVTNLPTICWLFDLYRNFPGRSLDEPQFNADIVITTDGGDGFHTIRQGVRKAEKQMFHGKQSKDVVFVGSPYYDVRRQMIERTNAEVVQNTRGLALNELLADTKIVLGDSYPADNYWSNRVYEITGRGGFLIHPKVEGLPEYIPQFERGEEQDMIEYYLHHENEREKLRQKQFEMCPTYHDRVQEFLAYVQG